MGENGEGWTEEGGGLRERGQNVCENEEIWKEIETKQREKKRERALLAPAM